MDELFWQLMNRANQLLDTFGVMVTEPLTRPPPEPEPVNRNTSTTVISGLKEVEVTRDHDTCSICLSGFGCKHSLEDVCEMPLEDMKGFLDERDVSHCHFVEKKDFRYAVAGIIKEDSKKTPVATRLPCGHEFHFSCIEEWLKRDHRCPVCRYELPTMYEEVDSQTMPEMESDGDEDFIPLGPHDHSGDESPIPCPVWCSEDQWNAHTREFQELMAAAASIRG